jgi:Protein of unknown function (DUF2510)
LTTPSAAPGWYGDSQDPTVVRWWDGAQWTPHTHPVAPPVLPALPPTPRGRFFAGSSDAPRALKPVVALLAANLSLSIALTIATILLRHSIVNYQLDHRHISDPTQRQILRDSYSYGILSRAVINVALSVVYVFLVRALLRGRRWAHRRVILISAAGIVGLGILQLAPYPAWMRVEQVLQAIVLATLLWLVLRPAVRSHFAQGLPGRDLRRFRSGTDSDRI